MRLLLDAHFSGRKIARALRVLGHDVRAVDEERDLDGLDDVELFRLAVEEHHVIVTANVKDFLPILREWAEGSHHHTGCILVSRSIRHEHFGAIIAGIQDALTERPAQEAWLDHVVWLSKSR